MSQFRDLMNLDIKQWLKARMGDTAYDIAGIIIRGVLFGAAAFAALSFIYVRTKF